MKALLKLFNKTLISTIVLMVSVNAQAKTQEWNFDVTLDGKPFGIHTFKLSTEGDTKTLKSEAHFNYKVLFINAYRYHHLAEEIWQGDCLQKIKAHTEQNGTETRVVGQQAVNGFVLSNAKKPEPLANCVMTFAYWNPRLLSQTKLLNPDTGDYLDSKISMLSNEPIAVRGEKIQTKHYVIDTIKFRIDLWYSLKDEWLALQSTTPEGRKVYYSLR